MNLLPIFYQILVLFLITLVGFILYRLKVVDDELITGITRLVMDVTLPALIITSMSFDFSREMLWEIGQLLMISLGLYLFSWIIAIIVTSRLKISDKYKDIFQFMLIFPNIGFMGYPVIDAIFGKQGLFYASIFNFTYGLVVWTLGVWIFRRREEKGFKFEWKRLLTPGMIAVLIGFIFFLFSIKLPYPIAYTLEMIGDITTPLSLLVIGALMGRSAIKEIWNNGLIYLTNILRLLIIPILVLVICMAFGLSGTLLAVSVILAGMPAAANTAMFASRYDGETDLAARIVFLSNLLSLVTIPGLVFLLQLF